MGRFEPLPPDPYGRLPGRFGTTCASCREVTRLGTKFCTNCDGLREDAELGHTVRYAASLWRRFFTRIADSLIVIVFSAVLALIMAEAGIIEIDFDSVGTDENLNLTVLIATAIWFLWFAVVAPRGLTPAKQLFGLRVIRADGEDVSTSQMWIREGIFQIFPILSSLLAEPILTSPDLLGQTLGVLSVAVPLLDSLLIFSRYPDRQTLHDRLVGTLVINVRAVRQPSAELRAL